MVKIKIFVNSRNNEIEADVNNWLESHPDIQIKQALQDTFFDSDIPWITLTFLYEVPLARHDIA